MGLPIDLACWDYDRTRALIDGRVTVEGVDLNYMPMEMPESFHRMFRHAEFHVSEMSFAWYLGSFFAQRRHMAAIPVFPSRMFRHSAIYVNRRSGIKEPSDLVGKRVGVPEYQQTAGVWIRGMLADDYGVPLDAVSYHQGGLTEPGRQDSALRRPEGIDLSPIAPDDTLSALLERGEIDALYTAHAPVGFAEGAEHVQRLFPDYRREEQAYYQRTGIFPIMHTVVIRTDVLDAHPWLARSLMKGFEEAKAIALHDVFEPVAAKCTLPWLMAEAEETEQVFGTRDFWPYGVERNRRTLERFVRYAHEQGLIPDRPAVEDLFPASTLDVARI
ncbi:ABC transporter substrate-binding protein [Streptomyces rugosispiralis]|uniref:ABC transporter substrate-binding protein n=1 Tax=Streptomyces rugosispiralis TaxID=2967341 RepID=A0ABT1UTJ2_9ACTN|nr:ABC transporter substrate-binding protein [Streptomyces rugosispiralis]MCQ8187875.1 ABC transporter substrate-binding protein [Streptomyces rugosispiralis]